MQTQKPRAYKITPTVRREIVQIIDDRIKEAHVTKEDFSELKAIVKDIGVKVGELTEAQKRTEEEVRKLAIGLNRTREDLGGLSRSFGYAFENEAYRSLPKVLNEKYGIALTDKVLRAEVGGKEINFFGRAEREGKELYIVGEAKTRLDEEKKREDVFLELQEKVLAVKKEYGEVSVVRLLVTHFATKGFLRKAEQEGIIVVQSYEW